MRGRAALQGANSRAYTQSASGRSRQQKLTRCHNGQLRFRMTDESGSSIRIRQCYSLATDGLFAGWASAMKGKQPESDIGTKSMGEIGEQSPVIRAWKSEACFGIVWMRGSPEEMFEGSFVSGSKPEAPDALQAYAESCAKGNCEGDGGCNSGSEDVGWAGEVVGV